MNRKLKGSITVFAALSFMLVASLISALIESARVQGARVMVAQAANMALDSLFASYEKELLDRYGVLLFDGADGGSEVDLEGLRQKISENMAFNLDTDKDMYVVKGHDFYGMTIDGITIDKVIAAPDAHGLVWRSMINDYAKMDYSVSLLEELLGIEGKTEENKKVGQAVDYMDSCCEVSSDFQRDYLKLIEHLDGIKTGASGINFDKLRTRSNYVKRLSAGIEAVTQERLSIDNESIYEVVAADIFDVDAFFRIFLERYYAVLYKGSLKTDELVSLSEILRSFFSGLKWEISQCMRLIKRMQSNREDLADKIGRAAKYLDSISTAINEESFRGLTEELSGIYGQEADIQDRCQGLDGIYEILSANYELMEQIISLCPDIRCMDKTPGDIPAEGEGYYRAYTEAAMLIGGYRTDGMYLDYTGLACRESDESILGCVYDYVQSGICGMVLPAGSEVSRKKLSNRQLADLYGARGDTGAYIEDKAKDIINEALFNIYIGDFFECYTDNDGQGLLDYEQEFILFGKDSDKENLTKAITAVAGIRLGCNLACIYTDSEKKQEAYNIALAALGFTGIMALVKGLQYIILSAWAIGETVVDLKFLMKGGRIPLVKKKEEWYLALDRLLSGDLGIDEEKEQEGLSYNQYLSCAMLFTDRQDKAYRTMAVVEMYMIAAGAKDFRLKNYIYGLEISVTYHVGSQKKQYTQKCSYTY